MIMSIFVSVKSPLCTLQPSTTGVHDMTASDGVSIDIQRHPHAIRRRERAGCAAGHRTAHRKSCKRAKKVLACNARASVGSTRDVSCVLCDDRVQCAACGNAGCAKAWQARRRGCDRGARRIAKPRRRPPGNRPKFVVPIWDGVPIIINNVRSTESPRAIATTAQNDRKVHTRRQANRPPAAGTYRKSRVCACALCIDVWVPPAEGGPHPSLCLRLNLISVRNASRCARIGMPYIFSVLPIAFICIWICSPVRRRLTGPSLRTCLRCRCPRTSGSLRVLRYPN